MATRSKQPGRRHVLGMQDDPWRDLKDLAASIRLVDDEALDLDVERAELHHVAQPQRQKIGQSRVDPQMAGRWHALRALGFAVWLGGNLQVAA